MAIRVIKVEIHTGKKAYRPGDVIFDLNKADEEKLVADGYAEYMEVVEPADVTENEGDKTGENSDPDNQDDDDGQKSKEPSHTEEGTDIKNEPASDLEEDAPEEVDPDEEEPPTAIPGIDLGNDAPAKRTRRTK